MQKFNILIAGCGDVGSALGTILAQHHQVYGLRRSINKLPSVILPIKADLNDVNTMTTLPSVDILVYCAAPNSAANDVYTDTYINGFKNVLSALDKPPQHIFFTSSTSVYHQDDHQWINEQSTTEPSTDKGKIMLCAEQQVMNSTSSATVVRFSGIYGSKRLHLLNQVKSGKVFDDSPIQYSNRIHLDDCAAVLAHLIGKLANAQLIETLYLASDNNPTPISEVMQWLAQVTNSLVSKFKSTRKASSKRCDNSLLVNSGYQFLHSDFKSGYQQIIADNSASL